MSEMEDDELFMTKVDNGSMTVLNILDYWRIQYDIPLYEIDTVKNYIRGLENEQR